MDIYFLLMLAFTTAFSFVFLLAGLNAEEGWHVILLFFLALLSSFFASFLWLAADISFSIVMWLFLLFMGIMDFVVVILYSLQAWQQRYPSRNRRYRPEE
jgi:apolipoprotein N-acyltransferase